MIDRVQQNGHQESEGLGSVAQGESRVIAQGGGPVGIDRSGLDAVHPAGEAVQSLQRVDVDE